MSRCGHAAPMPNPVRVRPIPVTISPARSAPTVPGMTMASVISAASTIQGPPTMAHLAAPLPAPDQTIAETSPARRHQRGHISRDQRRHTVQDLQEIGHENLGLHGDDEEAHRQVDRPQGRRPG